MAVPPGNLATVASPEPTAAVRCRGLVKRYDDVLAVDGLDLSVARGECFGLLGPNGAGKTTTLSMLSGLLAPDSGRITFDGVDLASDPLGCKRQLGVVPQEVAVYEELSALENVRFWGSLYGLSGKALGAAAERVLGQVGLTGRARDAVKTYSGGMKRRLNLALGLVHSPRAVLLDEVTAGIDPQARASILDVVRAVAESGAGVIYTTHYLEEAERLCDRIGIVDHGRLLAEGTLAELKAKLGEEEVVTLEGRFEADAARAALDGLPGVRVISAEPGRAAFTAGEKGAAGLLGEISNRGLAVDRVAIEPPSLNSLFLRLTGRALRD
jgi:ABC-2 type transport system ATP-binding protein